MSSDLPSPVELDRPPARDRLWSPGRRALIVGLILTITFVAFEALAISTVMPIIARDLGGLELYGWVFSAFFLGSLIGIVVVGGAIDARGLGRPFALGLGLFALGLVIAGVAPTMEVLVTARFLQGLGAGTIPPIAYVAIGRCLPEHHRPPMFALLSTAWVLPGVLGPALAGFVGETFGWRIVFLGLLPLIAVAAMTTYPAIRGITPPPAAERAESTASATVRRRLPLALLVAAGTALLTAGLTSGEPVLLVGLGLVGLAIGLPALHRLTPAGTLRAARGIPTAILLRGIATFVFFAVDAYVALALVEWRGQTATQAGITLTAATIAWTAGSWIQARNAARWGPDRFIRAGLLVVIAGIALFGLVLVREIPVWVAIPTFAIAGLGMGLAYAPMSLIVLRDARTGEQGTASAALSLTDALGTALGTGVTGATVAASLRSSGEPATGLAIGFAIAIVVALGGVALTGRLRRAVDDETAASGPTSTARDAPVSPKLVSTGG
jgi:MFS family permease